MSVIRANGYRTMDITAQGMALNEDVVRLLEQEADVLGYKGTVKAMNFKFHWQYSLERDAMQCRLRWNVGDLIRALDWLVDPNTMHQLHLRDITLKEAMSRLDLRAEVLFFKLHKHFPSHLREIKCLAEKPGKVLVVFRNGRELETPEEAMESRDFLAACTMIYDL